jgi:nitric oxide reductase subunit B
MEYWRWWVVHMWVEGIFEVFATAIVAALFVKMGLVRVSVAATSVLLATIIFLGGGVLGTFHHLYFSGTPTSVIALGAVFSALEVVPLVVVGFEAYNRTKSEHLHEWQSTYRWPFAFFASVLIWNLIGAGLFGFFIKCLLFGGAVAIIPLATGLEAQPGQPRTVPAAVLAGLVKHFIVIGAIEVGMLIIQSG